LTVPKAEALRRLNAILELVRDLTYRPPCFACGAGGVADDHHGTFTFKKLEELILDLERDGWDR
jgi:hypothetical protein